ncbi:MAG: GNAT family N-acetyltransferase [Halobacteriota archaeon]
MADMHIEELTTTAELREAYPVMEQLRPIDEETFLDLVDQMQREENYRLFALRDGPDDEIRGLVTLEVRTNLYHGKHVWVQELVVDEPHRSEGYGGRMLEWVAEWADDRDCSRVELASGLWRDEAHEFYERNGMEKYCYTFKLELSTDSPY